MYSNYKVIYLLFIKLLAHTTEWCWVQFVLNTVLQGRLERNTWALKVKADLCLIRFFNFSCSKSWLRFLTWAAVLFKIVWVLVICYVWTGLHRLGWWSSEFCSASKVSRIMITFCHINMSCVGSGRWKCNICNSVPLDVNIVSFLSVSQVNFYIRALHYTAVSYPRASGYLLMYSSIQIVRNMQLMMEK